MKKILFVFTCWVLTASINKAAGQEPAEGAYTKPDKILADDPGRRAGGDEPLKISPRALHHFKEVFNDTTGSRWYATKDGFIGKINRGNTNIRMGYSKTGIWEYSIRYYAESKLPLPIRNMVKQSYFDDSIDWVEEIDIKHNGLYYIVHLQDKHSFKKVLVHEDEMELIKEMEK